MEPTGLPAELLVCLLCEQGAANRSMAGDAASHEEDAPHGYNTTEPTWPVIPSKQRQSILQKSIATRTMLLWLAKYQVSDPKTSDDLGGLRRRRVVDVWDSELGGIGARQAGRKGDVRCRSPRCLCPDPQLASIFVHMEQ